MHEYPAVVPEKRKENNKNTILIKGPDKDIKRGSAKIINLIFLIFSLPAAIGGLWLWNMDGLSFQMSIPMGYDQSIVYDYKIQLAGMIAGLVLGIPASVAFRCLGKKVSAYAYGYGFIKGHFLNWLRKFDGVPDRFGCIKRCQIQLAGIELDVLLIGLSLITFHLTGFVFFVYFAVAMAPYTLFNFSFIFICDGANALNELIKTKDSKEVCEQAYERTTIHMDRSSGEWKRYFFLREILQKNKSREDLFDVITDSEYISEDNSRFEYAICFLFRLLLAVANLYAILMIICACAVS